MSDTPNLEMPELTAAQSQPEVQVNEALRILDAVVQLSVISATQTEPAGSPSQPADGATYIVPSGPTGDFVGQEGKIAYYNAGWIFITPRTGWEAYVQDTAARMRYGVGSPSLWQPIAGGGGGSVAVQNTGSPGAVVSAASTIQFEGAEVIDGGSGLARVIIPSGGSGGVDTLRSVMAVRRWCHQIPDSTNFFEGFPNSIGSHTGGSTGYSEGVGSSLIEAQPHRWSHSSTATNAEAGFRHGDKFWVFRDCTIAGAGGFFCRQDFFFKTDFSDQKAFVGLSTGTAAFGGSAVPGNLLNIAGVGKDQADTNLQLMHNDGSSTATKVDLGITFASLLNKLLALSLTVPDGGGDISYDLWNQTDNVHYTGTITTNMPAVDVKLYPHEWVSSGSATSQSARIGVMRAFMDTPY